MRFLTLSGLLLAAFLFWAPDARAQSSGCCQPANGGTCIDGTTASTCPSPNTLHLGQSCSQVAACNAASTQTSTSASTSSSATTSSSSGGIVTLPNPIRCNTATCLIGQAVRYILGIIAILATLMFIWGGFIMLTSGGNAQRVKQARETLTWAAIGVIIILLSWAIISTVLRAIIRG